MVAADTSAFLAVILGEDRADEMNVKLAKGTVFVPATVLIEAHMVSSRRGLQRVFWEYLSMLDSFVVSVDETVAETATQAFERFGKGRHSKASLNFCDCISYATAKVWNLPLLFVGEDFTYTDIRQG